MSDTGYRVRQSKFNLVAGCLGLISVLMLFGGWASYACYGLVRGKENSNYDFAGNILELCISISFMLIGLIIAVYCIYIYCKQTDIYYENKMIRKVGNKTIFELEYKHIISIKEGYYAIYLFCDKPIIKANGKKGPKTLMEHYAVNDKYRIKQIITNSINKLTFN